MPSERPVIRSIAAVDLGPRDVIVFEVSGRGLKVERLNKLHEIAKGLWPHNPCLILDEDTKLTIVTPSEDTEPQGHA
jgi:hypothetical protein